MMILYETYPCKQHPESGLCVAIERDGIRVVEITWASEDEIGKHGGRWLVQAALFTWSAYHERNRCYSGDDGSGRLRDRIVNGAISLIAYWGGEEKTFRRQNDAENYAYEYIRD